MKNTAKKDSERSLDLAVSSIEKAYGKGSIMRLGDSDAKVQVPVISSGSISIDLALGVGGYPRGRIVEIYGPESSGKTTLALHVVAEAQRNGGVAAFIDAEHALDISYARKLGVDTAELLVQAPFEEGEGLLTITRAGRRTFTWADLTLGNVSTLLATAAGSTQNALSPSKSLVE